MDSQNKSQSENFLQFLEKIARDCGFYGDRRQVFISRFNLSNLGMDNKNLASEIKWNNEIKDSDNVDSEDKQEILSQRFQDNLICIIKELNKKGFPIEEKKPGKPKSGDAPWQKADKWLWVEFKQWEAEQECNAVSEPDNLLPRKLEVYVRGENISRHYEPGYEKKELRVVNKGYIKGEPGGYIACYSRNPEKGVYCVGDGIYVIGLIWMKGSYIGRIFIPDGYKGKDISADAQLKQFCNVEFPPEGGEDCWPGGDTGGFLGYA